jgi:hypothetical protein
MLIFLSVSGGFLKNMGERDKEQERQETAKRQEENRKAFISKHRAPQGEHWLLVFDFAVPPTLDAQQQKQLVHRMEMLVGTMTEVLTDNLPQEFSKPLVVRIPKEGSPWREGIGPQNFHEAIGELNAFQIMWGHVLEKGVSAKAYLGLPKQLVSQDLDAIVPLEEVTLDEDPRREQQFGDGRYRLLGLVTLGIALDTYRQAQQSEGNQRKVLFLKAAAQLAKARELVNNRSDDNALKRTLYHSRVTELSRTALREAGASP